MADAGLSQDEIEALLSGADDAGASAFSPASTGGVTTGGLSGEELRNIRKVADTMANAQAGSLSAITTRSSAITVSACEQSTLSDALVGMDGEVLIYKINYSSPEMGNVFYVFGGEDGLKLASLMTGSETSNLDDMALSAIQEAFNQMLGGSDTSVQSEHKIIMVNSGPKLTVGSIPGNLTIPGGNYLAIKLSVQIEGSVNSSFVQLYPMGLAHALAKTKTSDPSKNNEVNMESLLNETSTRKDDIQNAEFSQLIQTQDPAVTGNINLLLDVPMDVTVELGRSSRTVQEVLSLGEGSIIELDKLAGEPVDLLVNGKPIAKGEVVVIDENFGVRVTEIVSQRQRLASAQ